MWNVTFKMYFSDFQLKIYEEIIENMVRMHIAEDRLWSSLLVIMTIELSYNYTICDQLRLQQFSIKKNITGDNFICDQSTFPGIIDSLSST